MRDQRGRLGVAFALIGIVVVLLGMGGGGLLYGRTQLDPVQAGHPAAVTIPVQKDESLDALTQDLAKHGLIKSAFWFGLFARFKGLPDHLRAGQYKLDPGMGASAIISQLEGTPDAAPGTLSLAEGLTVDQMADKVGGAGLGITRAQYLGAVAHDTFNAPALQLRPAGDSSLEGFLFPDTYRIPEGSAAHDVVQKQLDDFGTRVGGLLTATNSYEVVITASIVEREAKFPDDLARVASVIENRLKLGMRLQIDATVLYGLHKVGEAMSQADAAVDTPYNSYLHAGLPPTPISNPGLATIRAALQPASTDFLFYVTDGCGHNHYAATAAEHDQNIRQFLGRPCTS